MVFLTPLPCRYPYFQKYPHTPQVQKSPPDPTTFKKITSSHTHPIFSTIPYSRGVSEQNFSGSFIDSFSGSFMLNLVANIEHKHQILGVGLKLLLVLQNPIVKTNFIFLPLSQKTSCGNSIPFQQLGNFTYYRPKTF